MSAAVSKGESFWRHLISQRETLKLTVDEACEQTGVSRASFYHWQKRLRNAGREPEATAEQSSSLVPLKIVDDRAAEITLEMPNGIRIRVPQGCDETTLQCVLRAVLTTAQEQA